MPDSANSHGRQDAHDFSFCNFNPMNTELVIILSALLLINALFLFIYLEVRKQKREARPDSRGFTEEEGWDVSTTYDSTDLYSVIYSHK